MCVPQKKQYKADEIIKFIEKKKEKFWLKIRKGKIMEVFRWSLQNIPAYGDFLRKNKINPAGIKNFEQFQKIPSVSKSNYLTKYKLEKVACRCFLTKSTVFTSTSGSTGIPFYFPRREQLDWQYSIIAELFLRNGYLKEKEPTLIIVGFGMGVWIGGLITYKAFEIAGENGYPISIITPGINKTEIFNALKNLSLHFKQTILIGYPPFLKDVIDEAVNQEGIDLKKLNLRLLSAAETFTESFRNYLAKKAGIKNVYLDTLNIYGSADIGAMAFETPIAILIRRLALKNRELFRDIFSSINKTPTLAQYIPHFINFEADENGKILITGDNTIPLVRYDIGDNGGVLAFNEIKEKMKKHGINLIKEARKARIEKNIYELPFVYVYERNDFAVKLRLHDIYPEIIKNALMNKAINRYLTGKFSMSTRYDVYQNQYLEINLEMKKNKIPKMSLKKFIYNRILYAVKFKSSGPGDISEFGKSALIKIRFWPTEHPQYFKPGTKQKWVAKENQSNSKESKNSKLLTEVKKIIKKGRIKTVV